jgi:tRNA threonylcarbamoyladenosine biosynthesis protein TsaE
MSGTLEAFEDYFESKQIVIEWSENLTLNFQHFLEIKVYLEDGEHVYEIMESK